MLVYLKLLGAALLWGGTFIAGRLVSAELPPYSASMLRFALASVCLLWLLKRTEGGLPSMTPRTLAGVVLLGMTGVFGYNLCFFSGLASVHAGRAAVIVATNPIFIALLAAVVFREPLTRSKLVGILFSVSGAIWVISHGDPAALLRGSLSSGDIWIMGCVVSWVSYSLIGKAVMGGMSALAAVALSCTAGTVLLSVPALNEGLLDSLPTITPTVWASLCYLGIMGTVVGFTWFYEGVKTIGPSRAGVFINFVPVSAVLLSILILGEPIDLSLILGGALVITGTWCANRPVRG